MVLALVVAFGAAVAVLASAEVTGWTPCVEVNRNPEAFLTATECYDGSQKRQILSLAFAWPGALLLVAGCLLSLAFAIRGRGARAAIIATVAGVVLFGLSMLVSYIG